MLIDNERRLGLEDTFRFSCHPGLSCFNMCCRSLTLILMPYDIVRLKNCLGMSSTEFLEKYTEWHVGAATGLPVVTLKPENDACPFVTEKGCSVYSDRPASCRLYPLVRMRSPEEEYYHIVYEDFCEGHRQQKEWSVKEWIEDQGAEIYNRMNDVFMELVLGLYSSGKRLDEEEMAKFYTACYDVDMLRRVSDEFGCEVKEDDVEQMLEGIELMKRELLK